MDTDVTGSRVKITCWVGTGRVADHKRFDRGDSRRVRSALDIRQDSMVLKGIRM